MTMFQPSKYSTYGAPEGVEGITIEEQFVDPMERFDKFGVFIAEDNPKSMVGPLITMATGGLAGALSYKKNKSVLWAMGAMLIWPVALPYYIVTGELTKKA